MALAPSEQLRKRMPNDKGTDHTVTREPLVTSRALLMALLRSRESVMVALRPILKDYDLSEQQARVIRVLYRSDRLRISEVSARTFISMSSLTRIVRALEERSLLTRTVCENDQRAGVLALTESGKSLF